ncbi:MAG: NifB/NifX family molybdenum-iron cluster-binding protein [Pseudomonadota bacterium]
MSVTGIERDVALKIALAARSLATVSVNELLVGLSKCIDGELTEKSLSNLSVEELLSAINPIVEVPLALNDINDAIRIFRGERDLDALPLVPVATATPTESIPANSVKVAVASNNADLFDGHFGSCLRFLIYQVNRENYNLVDIRSAIPTELEEDKNKARADLIDDCDVVYMVSVGGPAAAKIIRAGIYPIKKPEGETAPQIIQELQTVMNDSPPPWLAKIMGDSAEKRIRFERSEEETLAE